MSQHQPSFLRTHRLHMLRGAVLWLIPFLLVTAWIWHKSPETLKAWESRVPRAEAAIATVYATPGITDKSGSTFNGTDGPPATVAIIMTHLGLSPPLVERALKDLPPTVTLAFSPYGDLQTHIAAAKKHGHEALTLLPMEPGTYPNDDPGPKALLTRASEHENTKTLTSILKASNGAIGVMNYMGDSFMRNEGQMNAAFETLRIAGGVFVERRDTHTTLAVAVAERNGVPYLGTDANIDSDATEAAIQKNLLALEDAARKRGTAVGVVEPYPVSFNTVKSWAQTLEKRGITLAPLSVVLAHRKAQTSTREDTPRENHAEQ